MILLMPISPHPCLPEIQPIVIKNIIQNLQNQKFPGFADIPNYSLKQLPINIIIYISKLTILISVIFF